MQRDPGPLHFSAGIHPSVPPAFQLHLFLSCSPLRESVLYSCGLLSHGGLFPDGSLHSHLPPSIAVLVCLPGGGQVSESLSGIESPLKWSGGMRTLEKECKESHKTQWLGPQGLGKPSFTQSFGNSVCKYLSPTYEASGRQDRQDACCHGADILVGRDQ